LRTAALALVYSSAEYCAPVWCRSAHTHHIDTAINGALRTITGCLCPTPLDNLPILAGIQPAGLRRKGATLSLARRALEPSHLLHTKLLAPTSQRPRRLKSRHPFAPAALHLLQSADNQDISATRWVDTKWNAEWQESPVRLRSFVPDADSHPIGFHLPRLAWVRLNRLRTGVGLFRSTLHKWGVATSASCECGLGEQTADHVILDCPIYHVPNGVRGLLDLDKDTIQWLLKSCPDV